MIIDHALVTHYQGLIFDMDGTLIDSMTCHAKAWTQVGEVMGYPLQSEIMYQFAGSPVHNIAREMLKQCGVQITEQQLEELVQLKRQFGRAILEKKAQLLPAFEVVEAFFGKIPLALGTGSQREITDMLVDKLAIRQYFNAIVTAEDIANHKPHPDTFLRCAELIKLNPTQCLVFEDADLGIQAALAAGMDVFDVRNQQLTRAK